MVLDKLKKLTMSKAPGVDLIGTKTLIELFEVVCDIVAEIYNKSLCRLQEISLKNGSRLANVTAVFKKGKSHLRQTIV